MCVKCVQTKPVNCTSVYKTVCKLNGINWYKLKVHNWKMKGEIQTNNQTPLYTTIYNCTPLSVNWFCVHLYRQLVLYTLHTA